MALVLFLMCGVCELLFSAFVDNKQGHTVMLWSKVTFMCFFHIIQCSGPDNQASIVLL